MSVVTTRALLLAHAADRNADRTVTALTEDFGLLTVAARSARGPAAKLGGVLEPFALTTLTFAEGRARPTALGSIPEESFRSLTTSPLGFAAAHVLTECLVGLQRERTGDAALFGSNVASFRALELAVRSGSSARAWWVVARAVLGLLAASGVGVVLERCSQCNRTVEGPAVWISGHGGLAHPQHAAFPGRLRILPEARRSLTALAEGTYTPPPGSLLPLALLLREVQLHTGKRLGSVRFARATGTLPLPPTVSRLLYS